MGSAGLAEFPRHVNAYLNPATRGNVGNELLLGAIPRIPDAWPQNAAAELKGLHEMFESTTARLRVQPLSLDHLSDSWNLLDATKKDIPNIEAKAREACQRCILTAIAATSR